MLRDSQVAKDICVAKKLLEKASTLLYEIDCEIDKEDREALIEKLFEYENISEKIVNNARLLPVISGTPHGKSMVEDVIIEINNVSIKYTDEGWFYIKIPSLLPKKEKGDPSYIRTTLSSAMTRYFLHHERTKFLEPCVLIFVHNYSCERKEREYRDHDNIELNAVVDMIALHVLVDDAPMKCQHYYRSKAAEEDCTEVFVVPTKDFILWLTNNSRKEG